MSPCLGATLTSDGKCRFEVWAPKAKIVEVCLLGNEHGVKDRLVPLTQESRGYHRAILPEIGPGSRYAFVLDGGRQLPDPASRAQPEGVHGPSEVVDLAFPWTDEPFRGIPVSEQVAYELHVGTFTRDGTFDGVISQLDRLADLGVNAIELMPVAQFPGDRNWGYDGVFPYAVQNSYGGAAGLQRLVNACHSRGLAVILDVVYNHLGPEGNYLGQYGPYFTDAYRTPWGEAINFDGRGSDEVRRYFLENALQWFEAFHIDALRLDAVHAILDRSAYPVLEELADQVRERMPRWGRRASLVAESDLNDPRVVLPGDRGGWGLDAMWSDDFHHCLHVLLTKETRGYYEDFGTVSDLARALTTGMTYDGRYSEFRERRHGRASKDLGPEHIVVCSQNHDQVGNRMLGDRLSTLTDFESLKLAAAVVLLSPFSPLLFMGEEYGETAPFLFFTSHGDPGLIDAMRKGRKEEFRSFGWKGEPPDPQDVETFRRCILSPEGARDPGQRKALSDLYRELIRMRKDLPRSPLKTIPLEQEQALFFFRGEGPGAVGILFHFGTRERPLALSPHFPEQPWTKKLDSAADSWGGPGSQLPDQIEGGADGEPIVVGPRSFAVYTIRCG